MSIILVLTGPSGVGKTSILEHVERKMSYRIRRGVSTTSRPPRVGEVEGIDYFFVSQDEIEEEVAAGNALNFLRYAGNTYAYLRSTFEAIREGGKDVVTIATRSGVIDLQKEYGDDVFAIFIEPPSKDELYTRMLEGGRDPDVIKDRMAIAEEELAQDRDLFDLVLVNDNLDAAVNEVLDFYFSVIDSNDGR